MPWDTTSCVQGTSAQPVMGTSSAQAHTVRCSRNEAVSPRSQVSAFQLALSTEQMLVLVCGHMALGVSLQRGCLPKGPLFETSRGGVGAGMGEELWMLLGEYPSQGRECSEPWGQMGSAYAIWSGECRREGSERTGWCPPG